MTTTTRPSLNTTRDAYLEAARFERWAKKTLLPAISGKVRFGLKGSPNKGTTYFHDKTDIVEITGRRAGITITIRSSESYWYQEYKRGIIELSWAEIDAYTA